MIAIFKHELKSYFHSLTAYVFGAFLLAVVGFGAVLCNIQAAFSNFELVFSFSSLVFVIIVPILTMRTIAEERRQKTDQLLLTSPVSPTSFCIPFRSQPPRLCWESIWRCLSSILFPCASSVDTP